MVDDDMENNDLKKEKKYFSTSETILLVLTTLIIGFSIGILVNKADVETKGNIIRDKYLRM